MTGYLAAVALVLLPVIVLTRAAVLRRNGIDALHFGSIDKTDFLIPPFALFYFYTAFAAAFGWPFASSQKFFHSAPAAWLGVGLCFGGLLVLLLSLISFGRSFRVGIDVDDPDHLVTDGIFAVSRNPIYDGFFLVLVGEFLVSPNWITLLYAIAGIVLFHRQVLREEAFMRTQYGQEYVEYCARVPRYIGIARSSAH